MRRAPKATGAGEFPAGGATDYNLLALTWLLYVRISGGMVHAAVAVVQVKT